MSSGKGTYANAIKDAIEKEFHISVYRVPSFSVKIADVARDLFGAKDEADGKPNRTLLQNIGHKMREIDSAVWANYLIRGIKAEGRQPFVVEGFRDLCELAAFRASFSDLVVVRIEADEAQRMEAYKRTYGQYPTRQQLEHPSEMAVAEMPSDLTLHNNFDKASLKLHVMGIISAVKEGTLLKA
jgi:hypothetical protein